ncbi:hypothetical protein V1525DRAFT_139907 [Lipomyces kononenkoae]|uniref:Uncharacterized protein n=1 Tax=Lipomyces kononenkoae TaxID=34357 RepID=A0ACC3TA59_LIPKO
MPAVPRQKACIACANAKRRCDMQLPACQRCLDRDINCTYGKPKRRRRAPLASNSPVEDLLALQTYASPGVLESGSDFGNWMAMETFHVDDSLPDLTIPYIPASSTPAIDISNKEIQLESDNIPRISRPWFLKDETWDMKHSYPEPSACNASVDPEPFIRTVREMLQFWVKNGYNSFIHRRLYQKGLPTCLQDAFTTFATYNGRTPAVNLTILQIAEERTSALASQSLSNDSSAQGILANLARVHALFIYEIIRLFDGSVRHRALAERQLPMLKQWVMQMWEAVKGYRGEEHARSHHALQWTRNETDRAYDASLEMWRSWILTESARRTHLVVSCTINMYQIMKDGWDECAGGVMFTARRGLWEAGSAGKWLELCCAKPPLLVPSLQPQPLIAQYAADEIDEFATILWTFVVGADKIQCWIDRSSKQAEHSLSQSDLIARTTTMSVIA